MNKARYVYLDTVYELVKQGEDIVIVSADYAAPSLDVFRRDFPERYVSVGIAEQNLIQVACGLALSGKRVVAYGMAPFPCIRAFDQIRNAVAMMKLPISIASAGVGFAIPEFGATHYNTEDVGMMRMIPDMKIVNITDTILAQSAAEQITRTDKPLYLRFDKYTGGKLYKKEDVDFEKGFYGFGNEGKIVIIASGYYTERMLELINKEPLKSIGCKVIDMYALKVDEKEFADEIREADYIITVEEHVRTCGIGTYILEILSDNNLVKKVKRIGIDFDKNYPAEFGKREIFWERYNLDDESIIHSILEFTQENKELING